MKTLKKTISKTKYVLLAMLISFSFSCSPEDGKDGAVGPAGTNGIDGADGEDGNANVQTFVFDTSSMSGGEFYLSLPELTQDVLDNDVILGYNQASNGTYYQMPGAGMLSNYIAKPYLYSESYNIRFDNWDGTLHSISAGDILLVKVIIIESSSTTTGKSTSKQQIYKELNQAGVDINDYYAVCDYYSIAY